MSSIVLEVVFFHSSRPVLSFLSHKTHETHEKQEEH